MLAENSSILQRVPEHPDLTRKYLFYLHGLIIEEAGVRPKSEEHGYYEYELILQEFVQLGFVVISEARKQGTLVQPYAKNIASQIKELLEAGVTPENITVVGASKGGIISAYISNMLQEKNMNFVFLAGLFEKCLVDESLKLYGNVLSIHDSTDKLSMTPALYFQRSEGLGVFKKIILSLGVGHGLIYKPHQEWIQPMKEWLNIK